MAHLATTARDRDLGRQLVIEAIAGAAAAASVAILAREADARRRDCRLPWERGADGSPNNLVGKLVEFALLRLAFRTVLHGVRFTARRLL